MFVRFLSTSIFLSAALLAPVAMAANTMSLAIGSSVPMAADYLTLKSGPSRAGGGERFTVKFAGAKTVTTVKISAFSTARNGKALIHNVIGLRAGAKFALEGLYKFGTPSVGNPTNYNGKNMLTDSASIEVAPNAMFSQLEFQIEGFTNDDASVLLQITTTDDLTMSDFLVTRSAKPSESVGGLIDESRYAKFTATELSSMMAAAKTPTAAVLAGKNFVCTGYSKLNPTRVNFKERSFAMSADGKLQSESDLEGGTQTWTASQVGLVRSIQNTNGCGNFTSYQIIRSVGSGSTISEIVVDHEAYVKLCVGAGYDENAVRTVEKNSTYPSAVNAKYSVGAYEFCTIQNSAQ